MLSIHRILFVGILALVLAPLQAKELAPWLSDIESSLSQGKKLTSISSDYGKWEKERQNQITSLREKSDNLFSQKKFDKSKEIDNNIATLEALQLSDKAIHDWVALIIKSYDNESDRKSALVELCQRTGWKPVWHYRDPVTKQVQVGGTFLPYQRIPCTVTGLPPYITSWRRSDGAMVREGYSFVPDIYEKEVLEPCFSITASFNTSYQDVTPPSPITWTEATRTIPTFPTVNASGERRFIDWKDRKSHHYKAGERLPQNVSTIYTAVWAAPRLSDVVLIDGNGDGQIEGGERIRLCPVIENNGIEDDGLYTVSLSSSSSLLSVVTPSVSFVPFAGRYQTATGSFSSKNDVLCNENDGISCVVSSKIDIGSTIPLTVLVKDNRGNSWSFTSSILVEGPKEMVNASTSMVIEDASPAEANQDGVLSGGEKGHLLLVVQNEAADRSIPCSVTATEESPYITISSESVSIPAIESGMQLGSQGRAYGDKGSALASWDNDKKGYFTIDVAPHAPESLIPVTLHFTDARHSWKQIVTIAVSGKAALPHAVLVALRPKGKPYFLTSTLVQRGMSYEVYPLVRNEGTAPLSSCTLSLESGNTVLGHYSVPTVASGAFSVLSMSFEKLNDALDTMRMLSINASPLQFAVPASVDVGSSLSLRVCFKDSYGGSWSDDLILSVGESDADPELAYYTATSGYAKKGSNEVTFYMDAVISNAGRSPLLPCTVSLLSENENVVCCSKTVRVGTMVPQGSSFFLSDPTVTKVEQSAIKGKSNTRNGLSFTVKGPSVKGDVLRMSLSINEVDGKSFVVPFEIVRR